MVLKEYADWKNNYVKGINGLLLFIPSAAINFVSKEFYEKFENRNNHGMSEWLEDMGRIKKVVDDDIENVKECMVHITTKYPSATFNPGYYGIEIKGLDDNEIVDCLAHKKLLFGVYVIDSEVPQND